MRHSRQLIIRFNPLKMGRARRVSPLLLVEFSSSYLKLYSAYLRCPGHYVGSEEISACESSVKGNLLALFSYSIFGFNNSRLCIELTEDIRTGIDCIVDNVVAGEETLTSAQKEAVKLMGELTQSSTLRLSTKAQELDLVHSDLHRIRNLKMNELQSKGPIGDVLTNIGSTTAKVRQVSKKPCYCADSFRRTVLQSFSFV